MTSEEYLSKLAQERDADIAAGRPVLGHESPTEKIDKLQAQLSRVTMQVEMMARQPKANDAADLGSLSGVLAIVRALKDVQAPPPPSAGMSEMLGMMTLVLDLRERIAESVTRPSEPESPMAAILASSIKPLTALLDRKLAIDERNGRNARALPNTSPEHAMPATRTLTANAAAPQTMKSDLHSLLSEIPAIALHFITDAAKREKDVELYADAFLDHVPDVMLPRLHGMLTSASALTELFDLIPAWLPYKAWIVKLISAVVDRLVSEIHDAGDEQPKPPTETPTAVADDDDDDTDEVADSEEIGAK